MNKKLLSFLVLAMLAGQSLQALTRFQVVERAALAAGVTSGFAYWYLLPREIIGDGLTQTKKTKLVSPIKFGNWSCDHPDEQKPLLGALGTFSVTYPFFAWFASQYTANARHEWVNKKFKHLEKEYLYNVTIADSNIEQVLVESGCESDGLSLVAAFLRLQSCNQLLVSMAYELKKAIKDTGSSSLRKKLKKQHAKVQDDILRIRNNEAIVKNHDKTAWLEQWKIHEKRELERERIREQGLQTHAHAHVVYNIR